MADDERFRNSVFRYEVWHYDHEAGKLGERIEGGVLKARDMSDAKAEATARTGSVTPERKKVFIFAPSD